MGKHFHGRDLEDWLPRPEPLKDDHWVFEARQLLSKVAASFGTREVEFTEVRERLHSDCSEFFHLGTSEREKAAVISYARTQTRWPDFLFPDFIA